jgi:hypothetical protein
MPRQQNNGIIVFTGSSRIPAISRAPTESKRLTALIRDPRAHETLLYVASVPLAIHGQSR